MQPVPAKPRAEAVAADVPTLAAIGVVAYALGNIVHEALGHGGACLLSGATPLAVSTVDMHCSADTRLVSAGGTLANFAAGALFFGLLRFARRSPRIYFFFWLCMTVNLLSATGYFLFSGVGGFGDWADFISGLGPEWLLRLALVAAGAVSYMAAVVFILLELRPLIGSEREERVRRAFRLMLIPYLTGGTLACIAGAFNPAGWRLIVLSAAASTFGGTSALAWSANWLRDPRRIPLGAWNGARPITRSWLWIAAGVVVAIAFIGLIGPGLRL
jgi:hypothetical protein